MAKYGTQTKSVKITNPVFVAPARKLSKEFSCAILRLMALTCLPSYRLQKDREYGRMLLLASGQAGDRAASRLLADYYRAGSNGFPRDKERSTYWWLRSERRHWSEQTPIYRFKLWKFSWNRNKDMSAIM